MENDATPSSLFASISVRISPVETMSGDHVTDSDAEDIDEDVELFAAIKTKMNPRKWVKKYKSQVGELDCSN